MMEDINYLAQQSSGRINMILSGMMSLMSDTDSKVAMLESQKWFQRMVKTVFGKNKLTQAEIQQNHDKLNAYVSEAIAELYNRNCIDHEVMMSLGTQLNEIYANNLQLKQMLGSFISKLNEKIDSIDNFHMLITEINQGVYSKNPPIISICMVISQLDKRILKDGRKLEIIRRSLITQQILNEQEGVLTDYLMNIIQMPIDEVGQIYLELRTISDNFMARIMLRIMDKYYFLPDIARKVKNKEMLVQEVIREEGLDDTVTLSVSEIYDDFINSKINIKTFLISNPQIQVEEKLEEAEKLFLDCKLDEAFEVFKVLAEQGNARAMYFMGEYYTHQYGHVGQDIEIGNQWRKKGYELGDVLSSLNVAYSFPEDSPERNELFDRMFKPTLELAQSGDVFAQNEIGELYFIGYIEEIDEEKKLYWLKKAAESGHWRSMCELGEWFEDNEKYSEAIKWYKKAAEKGYAAAENYLALCYAKGKGVEVDKYEAVKWYKKAAEHGLAIGQANLAYCYEYGEGVEQDLDKAIKWYKKAFENGDDESGTNLGLLLAEVGDYKEAVKWLRKSAEREDAVAENYLAFCYHEGKGVEVDKYEAVKWYKKAAEHGLAVGQYNLACCYHIGKGIEKNDKRAKQWLRKSAEQGYDNAINKLREWYKENTSTSNSYLNSSLTISSNTYMAIKGICTTFKNTHNSSIYDESYKLKSVFHLLDEEIYLAHDDTIFKNGKNGFAITVCGIYCREFMESYTTYVSFIDLACANCIYVKGSNIYADENLIAYISGISHEEREDLKGVFEKIAKLVKVDLD